MTANAQKPTSAHMYCVFIMPTLDYAHQKIVVIFVTRGMLWRPESCIGELD